MLRLWMSKLCEHLGSVMRAATLDSQIGKECIRLLCKHLLSSPAHMAHVAAPTAHGERLPRPVRAGAARRPAAVRGRRREPCRGRHLPMLRPATLQGQVDFNMVHTSLLTQSEHTRFTQSALSSRGNPLQYTAGTARAGEGRGGRAASVFSA